MPLAVRRLTGLAGQSSTLLLAKGMSRFSAALLWMSVATLLYTVAIFPLLVIIRGLLVKRRPQEADARPNVSVLIAAYNEGGDDPREARKPVVP